MGRLAFTAKKSTSGVCGITRCACRDDRLGVVNATGSGQNVELMHSTNAQPVVPG